MKPKLKKKYPFGLQIPLSLTQSVLCYGTMYLGEFSSSYVEVVFDEFGQGGQGVIRQTCTHHLGDEAIFKDSFMSQRKSTYLISLSPFFE
jgi:hypothetical protein